MKHSFLRRHYPYRYKGYNLSHCPGNSTPFSNYSFGLENPLQRYNNISKYQCFFSLNKKITFIFFVFQWFMKKKKYFFVEYFILLFC